MLAGGFSPAISCNCAKNNPIKTDGGKKLPWSPQISFPYTSEYSGLLWSADVAPGFFITFVIITIVMIIVFSYKCSTISEVKIKNGEKRQLRKFPR